MKKLITLSVLLAVLAGLTACVSTEESTGFTPPVVAAKENGLEPVALDEQVTGDSANYLADTIGPVTITVTEDTSFTSNDPVPGASMRMVEYLGKKALEVTANDYNEIRVAFVPKEPVPLAGYSKLYFSVAGFEGWDGIYNCGLLYQEARDSGERLGSFYVSPILPDEWTMVEANLATDEVWGQNFSEDRMLYCIQFWTNQSDKIYIADLALE